MLKLSRTISEAKSPIIDLSKSKEISYIIGVIRGDGCCYINQPKHRYVITLSVTSETFSNEFNSICHQIGFKTRKDILKHKNTNHNDLYIVRFFNKKFCEWYKQLSIDDVVKYINGNEQMFLKGFYESEGNIYKSKNENHNKSRYQIRIFNTNKELIDVICKILEQYTIKYTITIEKRFGKIINKNISKWKDKYTIHINRQEDIEHFLDVTNPCIKTKNKYEEIQNDFDTK